MAIAWRSEDYVHLEEIVARIETSLEERKPFSLVRVGDAENIVLAQEAVFSLGWIAEHVGWSHSPHYTGVVLPNLAIRDRMVEALKQADLVGVFVDDELTREIFAAHGIQPKAICYAFQNLYMPMYKPFVDLLRRVPPLLVGRPAERFAAFLREKIGVVVPGTVGIDSSADLDDCLAQMARIPHRWSLVSAGSNVVIIAAAMARDWGRVSIDFGHAPDNAMHPNEHFWLNTD
ncbi:MAG: GT-D fold domain-containing glycosyltransferase [Bacteroidota bacterium]